MAPLKTTFLGCLIFAATSACTTPNQAEFSESEVVERIGHAKETPEWATGAVTVLEEKGNAIFIGTISMSGDARSDACMRAAADTGRAEIVRHVKDGFSTSGQINELSATEDPAVEQLTAYLAQGKLTGIKVEARYWEKVTTSDTTGARVLKIQCSAKVSISKAELARQLREAQGNKGNAEVRKKLTEATNTFVESLGQENAAH